MVFKATISRQRQVGQRTETTGKILVQLHQSDLVGVRAPYTAMPPNLRETEAVAEL